MENQVSIASFGKKKLQLKHHLDNNHLAGTKDLIAIVVAGGGGGGGAFIYGGAGVFRRNIELIICGSTPYTAVVGSSLWINSLPNDNSDGGVSSLTVSGTI